MNYDQAIADQKQNYDELLGMTSTVIREKKLTFHLNYRSPSGISLFNLSFIIIQHENDEIDVMAAGTEAFVSHRLLRSFC